MVRCKETLKWINSDIFREEGKKFLQTGRYQKAPKNSLDWLKYWREQLERCKNGYVVDGWKITGHHYFYLNFTQIQVVEKVPNSKASKKTTRQPDFWDGDYDYFWCLEIAKEGVLNPNSQCWDLVTEEERIWSVQPERTEEELTALKEEILYKRIGLRVRIKSDSLDGGFHMIVGKSRRKGYSYKDGAICANIYNTTRNCQIIIGAYEKKFLYPLGTMGMASNYLNFLNKETAWTKSRDYVDKQDHKKASFKKVVNGVPLEEGYKSEIIALTFMDNPDAARGKDAVLVLLEEAGSFPNLKDSFAAISPALTAGSYITGQIIIFGTGGDMASGTVDFADMFYNPEVYRLLPFMNIWDKDAENSTCGFFHPVTWNMEGFYDEQGNSDIEAATEFEMKRRANIVSSSSSSAAIQKHIQEFPFSPAEAFLTVSSNNFPVVELRRQLDKVIHLGLQYTKGTPVSLHRENGKVKVTPDLKKELDPIYHYKVKNSGLTGAVIIYEFPMTDPPRGLYKIGYDPYRQDQSNGTSLTAILVYKGVEKGGWNNSSIVAEYVGRPGEADDCNEIAAMLAELYNTQVMHENEVTHVKNYFRRTKQLHLLALQPDAVISKNVKNSSVARVFGCHMNLQLKDAAEKYIKDWLLAVRDYDENGDPITTIDGIFSIGLLEELLLFNRKKGNFDRIMALAMCMFQIQEEVLGQEYEVGKEDESLQELISFFERRSLNR